MEQLISRGDPHGIFTYAPCFILSLLPLVPLLIERQGAGLRVDTSVHCKVFLCLYIISVYLILWPAYYSSWVSAGVCSDGLHLIPTIRLASQLLFYLLEVFGCGFSLCTFIMVPIGLWVTQVLVVVLLVAPPLQYR